MAGHSSEKKAIGFDVFLVSPRWLYFAVFAVSGFSGLIYESIWSHYLKLFLGHAAYAQSLVLAIFMGGMAVGSWLASRLSVRSTNPLLLYVLAEGIIGFAAIFFHQVFAQTIEAFYGSILPGVGSAGIGTTLKWLAAGLLIFPQSILLGMTFPFMSSGVLRRFPSTPGASISMLYFTNSIGAAIGVLASGFWMINALGLPGTILTAGVINVLLALFVWTMIKLDVEKTTRPILPPAGKEGLNRVSKFFILAAFITGAASFIYEIAWIRMLSLVLGATTHSFELMLSAFIAGLAFGGLWIKRRIDNIGSPVSFSGFVQIAMGMAAAATIPLYGYTFDWMAGLIQGLKTNDPGYQIYTVFSHGIALAVMLPTTFLAGMTLPLFTHVMMKDGGGERSIGRIYAANTTGAIVGVIFAVHVGLPMLGLKSLIIFGAALDVVLGIFLISQASVSMRGKALALASLAGVGTLVAAGLFSHMDERKLASGVYRVGIAQLPESADIEFYQDGKTASISLVRFDDQQLTVFTNGKPDASLQTDPDLPPTADEVTMVVAGSLPFAFKPDATLVANIGLGSGMTTHTILADEMITLLDTVEIERAMVVASEGFGERAERAHEDPRSRIHIEDAKTFFSLANKQYDFIVAEPSNPWVSGVASLFSDEFYRTIRRYMVDDGLFIQWIQTYEFNEQLALSIIAALERNFSDIEIYATDNSNLLFVAKKEGLLGEPQFERIFGTSLRPELEAVGLMNQHDLRVRKMGDRQSITAMLNASPTLANSDYFPFVDQNAAQARFKKTRFSYFLDLAAAPLPLGELGWSAGLDFASATYPAAFTRAVNVSRARAIRRFVMSQAPVDLEATVPVDVLSAADLLKRLAASCTMDSSVTQWERALVVLGQSTLPFLNPESGLEMLQHVLADECAESQSDWVRVWVSLMRSVAQRNTQDMAGYAKLLLESPVKIEFFQKNYLVATAMLGLMTDKKFGDLLELWEAHKLEIEAQGRPAPTHMRHMAAVGMLYLGMNF
jgi:predicted membrane-bound spermidine synthase